MNELEQLQAELEDLRRKSEKRSFKQVMKDGYNKVYHIFHYGPTCETETWVIFMFMVAILLLSALAAVFAFLIAAVYTKGLALLLLPIYPLYLIFRKEQ